MIRRTALFLTVSLMACSPMAIAADPDKPPTNVQELQQAIEKILESTNTPAIGVALVNRDGPYWVAGLGHADVKGDRHADADTLFRIGSISKMFAALAILKLSEEGKLSLDDKVRDRVPEIAFENQWEDTHPVRIAHLLEHTTGWDDMHLVEFAYSAPDSMTIRQGLDFHPHSRTSRWMPGTRHAYCNSGTAVAGYIVEKVTGQRFEDYIADNFFAPLGMTSTSYFRTKEYEERGAKLYVANQPQEYWALLHRPAGSINSSARDMAQLVHLLLLRGTTPNARLVSEQSMDRMERPETTLGAAAGVVGGYGLANYTSGFKNWNIAFHGHNGGVIGGLSELSYVKERGEGYVIMINSGNGAALGQISELIRAFLLRDVQSTYQPSANLPLPFTQLDGYYLPINPRNENLRFHSDLLGAYRISHDEKFLHRTPLLGSWVSSDRLTGSKLLIDAWHGLPAIALVDDPLAGPALQVNGDLLKRVPAWQVFGRFIVPLLLLVLSAVGLVTFLVWCYRRYSKKTSQDHRLWLRLAPLVASVALLVFLMSMALAGGFLQEVGSVSALSLLILVLSLIYPASVLLAAAQIFRPSNARRLNYPYWFAAVFVLAHLLIAGYFGAYGVIGVRTWA